MFNFQQQQKNHKEYKKKLCHLFKGKNKLTKIVPMKAHTSDLLDDKDFKHAQRAKGNQKNDA